MMIGFTILMVGLVAFELVGIWGKGSKKEMIVFMGLALITLLFGYYYISNPYRDSFGGIILKIYDDIAGR